MNERIFFMGKILILIISIAAVLIGCHKNNNASSMNNQQTIFKFTINGITDSVIGSGEQAGAEGTVIRKVYYNTSYYYNLSAQKNNGSGSTFSISLNLYTPVVTSTSYLFQYTGVTDFNVLIASGQGQTLSLESSFLNTVYESYKPGDETMISISKLQNNYADGIYNSLKLSDKNNCATCPASIQVTNGEFKNVKVIN
jgi:hypothetical protein